MEAVLQSGRVSSTADGALPWYLKVLLFGSTSIVLGLMWDLSWHLSIGRDTFWSPPHMAVYVGALAAGLACGAVALRTTFRGTPEDRAASVELWGFRAPLGVWVATWGAIAMLVSAPFDNWWHNAYGLDIQQFTPPHALLILGMVVIQTGTMYVAVALQNRAPSERTGYLSLSQLYAAGILLAMLIPVHLMEPNRRHGGSFYQIMAAVLPIFLVAAARSSRRRWAATVAASFYMVLVAALVWILPLFPAEARLGPVLTDVEHMAAPLFPLLLAPPALAIDLLLQRRRDKQAGWLDSIAIGISFLVIFFVIHWTFADFLMSPAARNWFFGVGKNISYAYPAPGPLSYQFFGLDPVTPVRFGIAVLWSIASTRLGLWWGAWMARVQR